jgi:hypothetical protein
MNNSVFSKRRQDATKRYVKRQVATIVESFSNKTIGEIKEIVDSSGSPLYNMVFDNILHSIRSISEKYYNIKVKRYQDGL